MARESKSKINAAAGLQVGTTSAVNQVLAATDTSGNVGFATLNSGTFTFYTQHSFVIGGTITAADIVPPFFIAENASTDTVTIEKARYQVLTGTNVTFKLTKNGSDFSYGTTASPLTATTTAASTSSSQSIADDDKIELDIIGVSGTPANLTVTIYTKHVILADGVGAPANTKGYVNHGSTAGTARPSGFGSIEWMGSVQPTNAVANDTWIDTS